MIVKDLSGDFKNAVKDILGVRLIEGFLMISLLCMNIFHLG